MLIRSKIINLIDERKFQLQEKRRKEQVVPNESYESLFTYGI